MNWIQWIMFGLEIVPKVLQLVKEIEQAIGGSNGAVKKELALNGVKVALTGAPKGSERAESIISEAIDMTVATLNTAGIFKHAQ
jgi:hypothetical protein